MDNSLAWHKAQLVHGFTQKPIIDYEDLFIYYHQNDFLFSYDCSSSHLWPWNPSNGCKKKKKNTGWKVLYEQPLCLDKFGAKHKVCELLHTTYGLKQSPHVWYECFNIYYKLGFLK